MKMTQSKTGQKIGRFLESASRVYPLSITPQNAHIQIELGL